MKTNKLWGIMLMLFIGLGMSLTLSSCGEDEDLGDKSDNKHNAMEINGKSSPITQASISLNENTSEIKLKTATYEIEIKFKGSSIPVGKNVEAYHIELEGNEEGKIVDGGPYKLTIKNESTNTYEIELPKSKGSNKDKGEVTFSAYYKGLFSVKTNY